MPSPFWLYYFNVEAIDAAVVRFKPRREGRQRPMETPNGRWILQGLDPQDATFALVVAKR